MRQRQAALKPGDIAVALELVLRPGERYEGLSRALGLSLSAAHRAVRRLEAAGLLLPTDRHPNKSALLEFLTHGVRYAFPAHLGAETRGLPTAGGLPEFRGEMPAGSGAVWPSVDGTVRGPSVVPLYDGAAAAALADARLHRLLGPLADELVFVGGRVADLLVTDPVGLRVRPTDNTDCVCEAATPVAYHASWRPRMGSSMRTGRREATGAEIPLAFL